MERKTIGALIAALRKANGMTQQDLADRLNVSNKAVSRWERDECAPDLSLIPVIAEIFGISCDELLRGECKSPSERVDAETECEATARGEKQRRRLLKSMMSRYQTQTYVAMGISVVGFIVALICNLAFLKAILGFLLGTVFFAASVICQAVFINRAFLGVEDAEVEEKDLSAFKKSVIGLAERSVGLTAAFVGFTLPFLMVDAYVGLSADHMLMFGAAGAVLILCIYGVICYFAGAYFIRKGVYTLSEKELAVYHRNHRLKKKYAIVLILVFAVTLIFHEIGAEMIWSPYNLSSQYAVVFDDYESFVAYMAQDIPYDTGNSYYGEDFTAVQERPVSLPQSAYQDGNVEWYDEEGNVVTEEEALTRTMEDIHGNVVCTYIARNRNVASVRYTRRDGTVLPIHVITTSDYLVAIRQSNLITTAYCVLYLFELLAVLFVYFRKRAV